MKASPRRAPAAHAAPPAVPGSAELRHALRETARGHVRRHRLVPPLSADELREHARAALAEAGAAAACLDFMTVLVSNELWSATLAAVPFERRVLLLPQCLRDPARCPAPTDAYGVLCTQCGACPVGPLQGEAEALGYVVLVAEGTTVVTRLIESGAVDAVVGVSCLQVLERAFPHLAAEAAPGIALPLLHDGCLHTAVDTDWVREAIRLRSDDPWMTRTDLDRLRAEVDGWFAPAALADRWPPGGPAVERAALAWMTRGGKRWRPFVLAAVYRSLRPAAGALPPAVRRLAVAVECFHKASLLHDDIEDGDAERYGLPALHRECGVPVAINTGDFLLGEGYRLVARCGAPADTVAAMLGAAAEAHRTLSVGQGEELQWMRRPVPLPSAEVLHIFRRKTAPAFEAALRLGALAAGADAATLGALPRFSAAFGTAYQVRDDLADWRAARGGDARARRPSIVAALAAEAARGDARRLLDAWWRGDPAVDAATLARCCEEAGGEERARQRLEHYRNEAVRSLAPLQHATLKTLLRRMVGRILER